VAGLGPREVLYLAYEAESGVAVDEARARWWEAHGSLRWGVNCARMATWFRDGSDRSVERAMVARRASESEIDVLRLLDGDW